VERDVREGARLKGGGSERGANYCGGDKGPILDKGGTWGMLQVSGLCGARKEVTGGGGGGVGGEEIKQAGENQGISKKKGVGRSRKRKRIYKQTILDTCAAIVEENRAHRTYGPEKGPTKNRIFSVNSTQWGANVWDQVANCKGLATKY